MRTVEYVHNLGGGMADLSLMSFTQATYMLLALNDKPVCLIAPRHVLDYKDRIGYDVVLPTLEEILKSYKIDVKEHEALNDGWTLQGEWHEIVSTGA